MTNEEKRVLEWAAAWAQGASDIADAAHGLESARSSDDARDRLAAEVNHRRTAAQFGEAELALLDAVRAMWASKRAR